MTLVLNFKVLAKFVCPLKRIKSLVLFVRSTSSYPSGVVHPFSQNSIYNDSLISDIWYKMVIKHVWTNMSNFETFININFKHHLSIFVFNSALPHSLKALNLLSGLFCYSLGCHNMMSPLKHLISFNKRKFQYLNLSTASSQMRLVTDVWLCKCIHVCPPGCALKIFKCLQQCFTCRLAIFSFFGR